VWTGSAQYRTNGGLRCVLYSTYVGHGTDSKGGGEEKGLRRLMDNSPSRTGVSQTFAEGGLFTPGPKRVLRASLPRRLGRGGRRLGPMGKCS